MATVGRRTWRAVGFGRSLGAVAAAAALPGLGHVLLGRRRTGAWVMGVFGAGAIAVIVTAVHLGRAGLLRSLVSSGVLLAVSVTCVLVMIAWMAVIMWTYVATEPGGRSPRHQIVGVVVSVALCAAVAVPLGTAADLAITQRALLGRVFAADPPPGPAALRPADPGLPQPLNVLLLGSDAGPDRTGARTDTMIVASLDTRTAATTLFALPRNIEHAPFPPGSSARRARR